MLSYYSDILCLPLVVTLQRASLLLTDSAKDQWWVSFVLSLFCFFSSLSFFFNLFIALCKCFFRLWIKFIQYLCNAQQAAQVQHHTIPYLVTSPLKIAAQIVVYFLKKWDIKTVVCVCVCLCMFLIIYLDAPCSAKPCSPTGTAPKPNSFLFRTSSRCNIKTSGTHRAKAQE